MYECLYVPLMHAALWYLSSHVLTARISESERPRAVCLTEQTWAELSTHGHADRSLDGLIINLPSSLFPASDGLCDWNNTFVIFACRVIRQLSNSDVSLHEAWTDLLLLSGCFDIFYEMWQMGFISMCTTHVRICLGCRRIRWVLSREREGVSLSSVHRRSLVGSQWRKLMNRKWQGRSVPSGVWGSGGGLEKRGHVDPLVVQHPSTVPHPRPESLQVCSGYVHWKSRKIISKHLCCISYLSTQNCYIIKSPKSELQPVK